METEEVIHAFTKSRAISKSSEVTSSVHQVLMENNLDTWFLEQLKTPGIQLLNTKFKHKNSKNKPKHRGIE